MKKSGFTLAEVLVTLGIIGVVAAIATPALVQNISNAKIAPKLQKIKATFETAAETMLTMNTATSINSLTGDAEELGNNLSRHMKITRVPHEDTGIAYKTFDGKSYLTAKNVEKTLGLRYDTEDGATIFINKSASIQHPAASYADIPNNQKIGNLYVDINGSEGPNRIAKDLFSFILYNDGTLRPFGARGADRSKASDNGLWGSNCNANGVHTTAAASQFACTGSIFDNGMKVIYK